MRIGLLASLLSVTACTAPGLKNFPFGDSEGSTTDTTGTTGTTDPVMTTTEDDSDGTAGMSGTTGTSTTGTGTGTTATSTTTTSTSTSTSGPAPGCGDAIVQAGEECDDGNVDDDDACNLACKRQRVVFITSEQFQPDNIGGLKFADGICRQLAQKAGLNNYASFNAWLSDSHEDAVQRVFPGMGRYVRPDGVKIADDLLALVTGPLEAAIQVDEAGNLRMGITVWTGTQSDGTGVPGATHCKDWTSGEINDFSGWFGEPTAVDSTWTLVTNPDVAPTSCVIAASLYCFEGK